VVATNSAGSHWGNPAVRHDRPENIDHPRWPAESTYSIVNSPLFGPNGPSFTDVRQGAVGDCWLESSLPRWRPAPVRTSGNMFTYAGTTVETASRSDCTTWRLYNTAGQARTTW